jgi:23S rRNA pseudouridine2605 synthase
MAELERIHRALARAGVASRRAAEQLVVQGRVTVNGEVAVVGRKVGPGDALEVDGRPVTAERRAVFLINKRRGVISTATDPQGRPTVVDELPTDLRLYPVGRLDRDTTGALLVTNDGELAHRLMHPRHGMTKEYEVLMKGDVPEIVVRRLRTGVELDDGVTRPVGIDRLGRRATGGTWLRFRLSEGRNRQIRRMANAVAHPVLRLHRPAYAGLDVGSLEPGEWRELSGEEISQLAAAVGLAR